MAGVAPQQRGGGNASTVAMVISIVVAVALAGVLIWLFTQQEQLRAQAENAVTAKNRLATGADEASAKRMFPDASAANKTLVGEMLKGVQLLTGRVTGDQNDAPQIAAEKLTSTLQRIAETGTLRDPSAIDQALGAVAIIENLYQSYENERSLRATAEQELDKATADLVAANTRLQELQDKFSADFAALSTRVEEMQTAKAQFEDIKNAEIQALANQIDQKQDSLDAIRRQQSDLRRGLVQEISERDRLLLEQKNALAALRGPGPLNAQPLAIAREPVGRILRALPGDSLVHIDLGRVDNVTLGMTFSVYSVGQPVPEDGRGKATIEVASIGERTSEARVTSPPSPDDPILDGDRVGNIILSRNRGKTQQFCIVGDFDIDFDGVPDLRGRQAIEALVERFGGRVVDTVDAFTDYVVVGVEPAPEPVDAGAFAGRPARPPQPPPVQDDFDDDFEDDADFDDDDFEDDADFEDDFDDDGFQDAGFDDEGDQTDDDFTDEPAPAAPEHVNGDALLPPKPRLIDPTLGPRTRRALTQRERYDQAIRRAELLSIPRLTQDRFLNFVGLEPGKSTARRLQD